MKTVATRRVALTGNEAVALAWKQIRPHVVAAYPITPATQIVERFSQYVADGEVDTEFIPVESEHSALSACVGAAAAGARVLTATASQGLALMHEILYVASGLRLPIVMNVGTRALSAPINIHGDHSDVMGSRDAGWVQMFARTVQEAYDRTILAVRVAERARLPVMVCLDGFTLTHSLEPVEVYPDEAVQAFLGEGPRDGSSLLGEEPITVGPLALPDSYMEFRRALAEAHARALRILEEETEAFHVHFGRDLPALLEPFGMEDAEESVVILGAYADVVEEAVRRWRERGRRLGMVRLVVFRPFPAEELRRVLARTSEVVVLERADTLSGLGGPLAVEVRAALYDLAERPRLTDAIFGLGGRELRDAELDAFLEAGPRGRVVYLGLKEAGDVPEPA
ncbi:MAG: pyruvate ferredoxin oxidoreductase [Armatimonadota bacterium]|nr:pyruvate ferredoxin oxidoreductase [Armatimonadota bacterium]MDR7445175.1 pyruvate ferredoxin oxidoreductase [Armatimonadota bacterium]MDR7571206.1 pyruvate ferredoxin oxidoreductase [Armatimonadota bacterium]MDR7613724.1 pyruvate ferredoxin oxidoreductase [Armatimonadota bacterium]